MNLFQYWNKFAGKKLANSFALFIDEKRKFLVYKEDQSVLLNNHKPNNANNTTIYVNVGPTDKFICYRLRTSFYVKVDNFYFCFFLKSQAVIYHILLSQICFRRLWFCVMRFFHFFLENLSPSISLLSYIPRFLQKSFPGNCIARLCFNFPFATFYVYLFLVQRLL